MKYALVRSNRSGELYVFYNHPMYRQDLSDIWEVLAENDDEELLLTMLELTKEKG